MGDYISIYKEDAFDKAMEILLNLTPGENVFGWQTLTSTAELPINLNTIIIPGNYIIHYYINGIEDKLITPLTFKVATISNVLKQMIIVGSDTYQRDFNTNTNLFDSEWKFFNESMVIYKGIDEPPYPDINTLWLKYGIGIEPILQKYNGTIWIDVQSDHYMDATIYDPNKRRIDIMDYLKSELNKSTIMINDNATANSTPKIFTNTIIPNASIALGQNKCLALAKRSDGLSLQLMYKDITDLSDNTKQWYLYQDMWISFTEYSKFLYSSENPNFMGGQFIVLSNNKIYKIHESELGWDEVTELQNIIFAKAINNTAYFVKADQTTGVPIQLIKTNDFILFETFNLVFEDIESMAFNKNIIYNTTEIDGGGVYNANEAVINNTSYNETIIYYDIHDLIYVNGFYYLTGYNSEGSSYYYKSEDLENWYIKSFPYTGIWKSILYGNDTFFTYTEENPGFSISSIDGENWSLSQIDLVGKNTKYKTGIFYDVSIDGRFRYFTSNDSNTLKVITLGLSGIISESIFFIDNKFYFLQKDTNGLYLFNITGSNYSDIFNTHNIDTNIHLSVDEKSAFDGKLGTDELTQKINTFKSNNEAYTNTSISNLNLTGLNNDISLLNDTVETHKNDVIKHVSSERASWNSKALNTHQHLSDGKVQLDTIDVISGIIDINRLPGEVFDKVYTVISNTARLALTTTQVQNGDSVHVYSVDPAINEWYRVIDDTKLTLEDGYKKFSENPEATMVDFTGVQEHPTNISGYGIIDVYNKTEIATNLNNSKSPTKVAINDKIVDYDHSITVDGFNYEQIYDGMNYSFNKLFYHNGQFILFGYMVIFTSPDGINWTKLVSDDYSTLKLSVSDIIFENGLYIAISDAKTIVTSSNLINWVIKSYITTNTYMISIKYGNGIYVVAGNRGEVHTSPDLITWTKSPIDVTTSIYFTKVKFLNNQFFVISPGTPIFSSLTGTTWNKILSFNLYDIIYENNLFVVIGDSGMIETSPDGITWTLRTTSTSFSLRSIIYENNLFVVVGNSGTVLTSPDGITWTHRYTDGGTSALTHITYGNDMFLAEGANIIVTSPDGITWKDAFYTSERKFIDFQGNSTLIYGNGIFVSYGSGFTLASYHGTKWIYGISVDLPYERWVSNGNIKIFLTYNRFMMISYDNGKTWEVPNYYFGKYLREIIYENGKFVMVGDASSIWVSTNGITWDKYTAPVVDDYWYITYGNGLYVAIGDSNKSIITSPDGITWTDRSANVTIITDIVITSGSLMDIVYGNGKFIIAANEQVGYDRYSHLITSTDGINWTERRLITDYGISLYDSVFVDGRFVLVSSAFDLGKVVISISTDGENWIHRAFDTPEGDVYFLSYHDGCYTALDSYAVGLMHFYINEGSVNELANKIYNTIDESQNVIDIIKKDSFAVVNPPYPTVGLESSNDYVSARFLNGQYIILTKPYPDDNILYRSNDGINWASVTIATSGGILSDIAYGNGVYVAIGLSEEIFISTDDCATWISKSLPYIDGRFWAVIYENGKFIMVGEYIFTSSDNGVTWVETGLGVTSRELDDCMYDIKYGNGMFLAIAEGSLENVNWTYGGKIYKSLDGITWTKSYTAEGSGFMSLAYGNGLFVLTEYAGQIRTSIDGVNWANQPTPATDYPKPFDYFQNRFIGVLGPEGLLTSIDGIQWEVIPVNVLINVVSIITGNDKILVIGEVPFKITDVTRDLSKIVDVERTKFISDQSSLLPIIENSKNALELF